MTPRSAPALVAAVAEAFELPAAALTGRCRDRYTVAARQAAMWALRARYGLSTPQIGRLLGDRDHSTVIHGLRAAAAHRAADPDYAARLDALAGRPGATGGIL